MEPIVAILSLTGALIALTLSVISLVLHWIRRAESPEISGVMTIIQEVKTQHLDLLDKVEHWRRRDNVRRARQGAEEKQQAADPAVTPAEKKKELRTRAAASGLGVVSR